MAIAGHAAALVSVVVLLGSCLLHPRGQATWLTRDQLNYIRVAISEFDSINGRLPAKIEEICRVGAPCPGLRDAWGEAFIYERIADEYELRSKGADRTNGSEDDIVFRPSAERRVVQEAAGCYRADLAWWKEYSGEDLVLDTLAFGPGVFALRPALKDRFFRAYWTVSPGDSVVLEWGRVDAIARIKLKLSGDTLVGMATIPRYRARRLIVRRTHCN
jgi:hypothetical protein